MAISKSIIEKAYNTINELYQEYLLTLDDTDKDEWYVTERAHANDPWANFTQWLVDVKDLTL